jgi:hypothetical protein
MRYQVSNLRVRSGCVLTDTSKDVVRIILVSRLSRTRRGGVGTRS